MGLFDKIKEPRFMKEGTSLQTQLNELEALLAEGNAADEAKCRRQILLLQAGLAGENNLAFELKNSHMPMIVLQDLVLERGGLEAQLDFLIITRKRHFIVECKNLAGTVKVDNAGNFTRTFGSFTEGIYSPITQNQRHLDLLREVRRDSKDSFLSRLMFDKFFSDTYRSIVVVANPKTILQTKYAPKEIRHQIIKADQLIEYIKKVNAEPGMEETGDKPMLELAEFYLAQHIEKTIDYTEKYRAPQKSPTEKICPACGAPMVLRTAKRGASIGQQFWGCSKYPVCKMTQGSDI